MPSAAADQPILDLRHVKKTYRGRVHALRGVSMRIQPGEVFGLLGPNGAGKSTLVKILMTVVRPSECDGDLLGRPVGDKASLRRVGYLPENPRFPDYLTGAQLLDTYGALSELPRAVRRRRAAETLSLVGMSKWASRRTGTYSKGMRQRLGLAHALMNDPALVVLDEPTDGVDPVGRREIRELLVRMRADGRAVLLNSHLLGEAEMVCDRVSILVQGRVAREGSLDELASNTRRYEIECDGALPAGERFRDLLQRLGATVQAVASSPADATTRASGAGRSVLSIPSDDAAAVQPLLDALRAGGVVIRSLRPHRSSLEDLFLEIVVDPATGESTVGADRERRARKGRRTA